eukprot:269308_1
MGCCTSTTGVNLSNPLVIGISIGEADESPKNVPFKGYLPGINGADRDIQNIAHLCGVYQYTNVTENTLYWTESSINKFLKNKAKQCFDDNGHLLYDGVLIIICSSGYQGNIITSNYQLINKDTIDKLFTQEYSELLKIPRVIIFDSDDSNDNNISNKQSDNDTLYNPIITDTSDDNLLVVIKTNTAKMSLIYGSYLTDLFVKELVDNVPKFNKGKCLGDIVNTVGTSLRDRGKQKVFSYFSNDTRSIKFVKNKASKVT